MFRASSLYNKQDLFQVCRIILIFWHLVPLYNTPQKCHEPVKVNMKYFKYEKKHKIIEQVTFCRNHTSQNRNE